MCISVKSIGSNNCGVRQQIVGSRRIAPRLRHGVMAAVLAAAVAGPLFLGAASARAAAPIDWSGTAGTNAWATGSNWIGGTAPADSLTTDVARFNQTSYLNQPWVNSPISIGGIVVGDGTTVTGPLAITNVNGFAIGASGITMSANAGPATIGTGYNGYLYLGASQTWTNSSDSALTASGVYSTAAGPVTLTLSSSGSGGFNIAGLDGWGRGIGDTAPWNNDGKSATAPVTLVVNMTGTGCLTLLASDNTTGGLNLQSGTVNVLRGGNGVGSGPITLGSSGSANASIYLGGQMNVAGNITTASGSTGKLTINASSNTYDNGNCIFSGAVTLNSDLTVAELSTGATMTFSGALSGSGKFLVGGTNAVLGARNNTVGGYNLGTVILSGASPSFASTMVVNTGTLTLTGSIGAAGLTMYGAWSTYVTNNQPVLTSGGAFNYTPTVTGSSQTLGTLTLAAGDNTAQATNGALTFGSLAARTSGATGNFVTSGTGTIVVTGATGFVGSDIFFNGGTGSATYAFVDSGTGLLRAFNYTSDPNALNVTTTSTTGIGTVNASDPFSNVQVGNVAISGQPTAQISTLQLGTSNFALASGATLTVNGILKAGGTAGGTISGGTGITPANNANLVVRTDQLSDTLTISSPILATGANALVKSGPGTLTVGGTNSLTGGLILNGGIYKVSADSALGATGGGITFNGGILQSTSSNGSTWLASARAITVSSAGGGIIVGSPSTVTIANTISGTGTLSFGTPYNGNTYVLSGTNSSFSGVLQAYGRLTLQLANANAAGTGQVCFNNGGSSATLQLRNDTSTTFAFSNFDPGDNAITIDVASLSTSAVTPQALTINSLSDVTMWRTLNLTGAANYNLAITNLNLSNWTLNPTTTNVAIGKITPNYQSYGITDTSVTLSGTSTGNTVGSISSGLGSAATMSVNVTGGGWTITGASSYTGATTISGASTVLTVANSSGSATGTGNVTINAGKLASGTVGTISGSLIAGSGAHFISPGGDGSIGALSVGSLVLNSNSTLRFDIASTSSHDLITALGAASFSGSGTASLLLPSLTPGTYKLLSFGSSTLSTGNFALNYIAGGAAPAEYSLVLSGTEMDLLVAAAGNTSTLTLSPTSLSLRAMKNSSSTTTTTVHESSGTMGGTFSATPSAAVTASPATGSVATSGNTAISVGFADYANTGSRSGTVTVLNTANSLDPLNSGGNVVAVAGAVVDNRVVSATTVTAGIHAGASSSVTAVSTLSTTGDDNHFTRVTVGTVAAPDSNGFTAVGGAGTTFNSASATDTRSITSSAPLNTTGAIYTGTFTLTTTGEGLAGEAKINVTLPYTITVFSGNANWTNTGGDSTWSNDSNWTDASSSATLGAPGLAGAVSIGDQAHFSGSGGTISLGNATPHIANLTLTGSPIYTLAQGTGSGVLRMDNGSSTATITASNAAHVISAAVALDSNTQVTLAAATDQLTMSGNISGSGSLTATGAGTLALSGNNTFTGGVVISGGATLSVPVTPTMAALGIPSGTGITVNSGTLNFSGTNTANVDSSITLSHPITINGATTITSAGMAYNYVYSRMDIINLTISSNITGSGPLTLANQKFTGVTFSGDNSAFSGGMTAVSLVPLTFAGAASTGTGSISLQWTGGSGNTINLLSETAATMLTSNILTGGSPISYLNVDHLSAATGNTITVNGVTSYLQLNVTGGHGYNLGITTLTSTGATLIPSSANLYIGTVTGSNTLTLSGTATGNTIGAINTGAGTLAVPSGAWTITGASSYTGATTLSGGTLIVANASGSATGTGNVTINSGKLASGTLGAISGNVLAGSGAHSISPGGDGAVGTLSVGGLTLNSNSTLRFDITSTSVLDHINATNALSFSGSGAATLLVPSVIPGTYKLIGYNSTALTSSAFTLGLIGGGTVPPEYRLIIAGGELDLRVYIAGNTSALALNSTSAVLRAMKNNASTTTVNLNETSGTAAANFSAALSAAVTVTPSTGSVAAAGSNALAFGYADYSTTGARSGTVTLVNTANGDDPFSGANNVVNVSGAVVDNRVVTASSLTGRGLHSGVGANASFTLSTTGDDNHFTRVTVGNVATADPNGFTITGGNALFNAASVTDIRALTSTTALTPGSSVYEGSFTLTTTAEGLPGEIPVSVSVPYSVMVFSGNADWTNTGGDSTWSNDSNWTDASSSATLGAPGLAGAVSIGDQAHFSGSGGTISLGNAVPHIANLTLTGSSAYTLAQGTGSGVLRMDNGSSAATITASSAAHVISAAVALDSNTQVTLAAATDQVTLSGNVSGSGSLTATGAGTLALSGTNTFTGGVVISGGATLSVPVTPTMAALGTPSGTGITVNSGTLFFSNTFAWNVDSYITLSHPITINGTTTITSAGMAYNYVYSRMDIVDLAIASNITGSGSIGLGGYTYNTANQKFTSVALSGDNSGYSGAITAAQQGMILELDGPKSSGTGTITFINWAGGNTYPILHLRNDASAAFLASNVDTGGGNDVAIDVDQLTSAGSGNTLTLNTLTARGAVNITGNHGYNLGIGTLAVNGARTLNPTTASVAIGTVSGTGNLTLSGTAAGNTIAAINTDGSSLTVLGGTWALTGPSSYTGATTVSGGSLTLDSTATLSSTTFSVASSATANLNGATASALTVSNLGTVNVSGTATVGTIQSTSAFQSSYSGTTAVAASGNLTANVIRQDTLSIGLNGSVKLNESFPGLLATDGWPAGSDSAVSIITHLTFDPTAKFNVTNNDLILTGVSLGNVEKMVRDGYDGGNWDGNGTANGLGAIYSSDAAARNIFTLLVLPGSAFPSGFDGVTAIPADAVVVKFTHEADLNGDGIVTGTGANNDLALFAGYYAAYNVDNGTSTQRAVTHAQGDMDFDGQLTFNDAMLFMNYYNTGLEHLPEPTSLAFLALGAAGLLARKRR